MSTKNLSRTVIEGGRHARNGWERRHSNQVLRVRTREHCRDLRQVDALDAASPPVRAVVYRSFDDKLAPALRWLLSQVGQPWNKVREELFKRFDTRTTAGRHIVFCHMLPWVEREGHAAKLRVDERGMLRKLPERGRRRREVPAPLPEPRAVLEAWLAERAVEALGSRFYWFDKTKAGFFRQARELDASERARWVALPTWFRNEMNVASALRREREKASRCIT
jgi:hypothetical protein